MSGLRRIVAISVALIVILACLGLLYRKSVAGNAPVVFGSVGLSDPEPDQLAIHQQSIAPVEQLYSGSPTCVVPLTQVHEKQDITTWLQLGQDGRSVSGRVLDPQRNAISDASVILYEEIDDIRIQEVLLAQAISDGTGHFTLRANTGPSEDRSAAWRILVSASGFTPVACRITPVGGVVEVVMPISVRLTGSVRFVDGEPVARAAIRFKDPYALVRQTESPVILAAWLIGVTDDIGEFDIPIPEGASKVTVVIAHDQHLSRQQLDLGPPDSLGRSRRQEIVVERQASVEVRVTEGIVQWQAFQYEPRILLARNGNIDDSRNVSQALSDRVARFVRVEPGCYDVVLACGAIEVVLAEGIVVVPGEQVAYTQLPDLGSVRMAAGQWIIAVEVGYADSSAVSSPVLAGPVALLIEDVAGRSTTVWVQYGSKAIPVLVDLEPPVAVSVLTGAPSRSVEVWPGGLASFDRRLEWDKPYVGSIDILLPDNGRLGPAECSLSPNGSEWYYYENVSSIYGLRPGVWHVNCSAPGTVPTSEEVEVGENSTTTVRPSPLSECPEGVLLTGTIDLLAVDSWLRCSEVHLEPIGNGDSRSLVVRGNAFRGHVQPGSYKGRVSLVRPVAPEWQRDLIERDGVELWKASEVPGVFGEFSVDIECEADRWIDLQVDATRLLPVVLKLDGVMPLDEGKDVSVCLIGPSIPHEMERETWYEWQGVTVPMVSVALLSGTYRCRVIVGDSEGQAEVVVSGAVASDGEPQVVSVPIGGTANENVR